MRALRRSLCAPLLAALIAIPAARADSSSTPFAKLVEHSEWLTGHTDMFCRGGPEAQGLRIDAINSTRRLGETWQFEQFLSPGLQHPLFAPWTDSAATAPRLEATVTGPPVSRSDPFSIESRPEELRGLAALTWLMDGEGTGWLKSGEQFEARCIYAYAITIQLQRAARALAGRPPP